MANAHLKLVPHQGCETLGDWWWYEEPGGIAAYTAKLPSPDCRVAFIPWRALRNAIARKDRK